MDRISPGSEAATYTEKYKHRKHAGISMPQVKFEPTIPLLEGTKIFCALDRATTVAD